jgi:hypothetical protein
MKEICCQKGMTPLLYDKNSSNLRKIVGQGSESGTGSGSGLRIQARIQEVIYYGSTTLRLTMLDFLVLNQHLTLLLNPKFDVF